ncbi:transcriptional regulator, TetR family [Actinacidiphila yanglinensis]|uniref:Transcriptional regulator, TetR family n=1 Tax=Actinacidiphila yanglinensis TaxID=310779 RepID=A0A1H5W3A6_9ACTN|nr:TetR/AcrR family transcriptional regulator [Actinacidiphila yanglinensis]SEF93955.1 transcriptional regulator, TetR family [Actinacidiphila yanglinensis]
MAAHKRLNRDELVATALGVIDAEGLEAVTIRRVAQQHDVTPMALYRHFPDKDGLLDAIAERLLDEVEVPEADDRPWHEQLEDLLSGVLDSLRPHPNAAVLLINRIVASEAGLDLTERVLTQLEAAGMDVQQAADSACHVLFSLITLVIGEPGVAAGSAEEQDAELRGRRAYLQSLPPRRYPHVVNAADALSMCASAELYYRRGLELIVTGLRGLQNAARPVAG